MRKPRRLTNEQLAPWVWEMPKARAPELVSYDDAALHALASDSCALASVREAAQATYSPQPIDWRALFGNANPVEIEVGTGKGLFLLNAATERPDLPFYVGVQWHPERMLDSPVTRKLTGAFVDAARGAAVRG